MNLIDESAHTLLGVMQAVRPSENADGSVASQLDGAEIRSVCKCAREIEKLMRLKLEVLRLRGR